MSRGNFIDAASTLTPEQKRAVGLLKSALAACKEADVVFHNANDVLSFFNGRFVKYIAVEGNSQPDYALDINAHEASSTGYILLPFSSAADDASMHWIVPTGEGQELYYDGEGDCEEG